MAKPANRFPGVTKALKDQIGAVDQRSVEVKEYRPGIAMKEFRLSRIDDQAQNYIWLRPAKANITAESISGRNITRLVEKGSERTL